jgi:hypothetical protein
MVTLVLGKNECFHLLMIKDLLKDLLSILVIRLPLWSITHKNLRKYLEKLVDYFEFIIHVLLRLNFLFLLKNLLNWDENQQVKAHNSNLR